MSFNYLQNSDIVFGFKSEDWGDKTTATILGEVVSPGKSTIESSTSTNTTNSSFLSPLTELCTPLVLAPATTRTEMAKVHEDGHHSGFVDSPQESHEILNTSDSFTEQDTVPTLIMSDAPKHERFRKSVPTLCYNGHVYRKVPVSSFEEKLEWECSKRYALGCGGLVTTNYNLDDIQLEVRHCHPMSYTYIEAVHKGTHKELQKQVPNDIISTSPKQSKVSIEYAPDTSSNDDESDGGNNNEDETPDYHGNRDDILSEEAIDGVKIKQEFPTDLSVELLTNNKGGMTLFYKGYQYNKNSVRGKTIRWKCSKRKKYKCNGGLVTDLNYRKECVSGEHKHPTSGISTEVHKARTAMRDKVDPFNPKKRPKEIFAEELAKCSEETKQKLLANRDTIIRALNHRKQKLIEDAGITLPSKPTASKVDVLPPDSPFYNKKEIIQGQTGGVKLYFEGYCYNVKANIKPGKKKMRWECSKKSLYHCRGNVLTDENYENVQMTLNHNHERNSTEPEVLKLRNAMKERAYETDLKAGEIIREQLEGVSEELRAAVGSQDLLTRMLNRKINEKALKREAEGGEPVRKKPRKDEEQEFVEDTPHWSIIFKKEILKNNRGGVKISYEGYMYTKKTEAKNRITWECSQRRAYHCSGALTTDKDYNNARMIHPHTHERSTTAAEVSRIRQALKDRMLQTLDSPGKVLAQELDHLPESIRTQVGSKESIKRVLRKIKQMALRGEYCDKVDVSGGGGVEVLDDCEVGSGEMWGEEGGSGDKDDEAIGQGGDIEEEEEGEDEMSSRLVPIGPKETSLSLGSCQSNATTSCSQNLSENNVMDTGVGLGLCKLEGCYQGDIS